MTNTTLEKWEEKTLGDVCTFLNGFAFESKKLKNIKDKNNNIPVIKIGNLQPNETVSLKESQYSYYDNSLSNFLIKKNDILFAMSGATVGKVSLFLSEEKALLNQRVGLIRLNEERTSLKFLLYQLYDKNFYDYCQRTSGGAAQPNISLKQVAHYQIKHPPLPEQERIVAKLDKAFEAIDKVKANAEQNLNNAKELFESALDKAFTENTEGWEEKTLEKIGNIQTGTTPKTSEKDNFGNYIPFIKPADFNPDGTLNYNNEGLSEKGLKVARFIPKNSVLMVCIGATITKTGYSEIDTTCNQQINTLTPTKDSCKFIYYAMVRKEFKEKILAGCPQTTLPIINKSNWSALTIKLPKIDEQQKIVEKLDVLQEQAKQLEQIYTQKIKECDELKQSILQKAFRGEL